MAKTHKKTLEAIFKTPTPANIRWDDIESLFLYLGAKIYEGRGSCIRVILNGRPSVFHRPHPKKETDKGAVGSVREFLILAGVDPWQI